MAERLQLTKKSHNIPIGALNDLSTISTYSVSTMIQSRYNTYNQKLEFLSVPTITFTPEQQIDRSQLNIPSNIPLADPKFHIPAPVHLLIGAGTALSILCIGQIKLSNTSLQDLILQKTQLGWVIGGSVSTSTPLYQKGKCYSTSVVNDLSKFWEINDCTTPLAISSEEKMCEDHFKNNVTRSSDGRYVVALPFNEKRHNLGETYHMALKRFQSLERKFKKDNNLQEQYTKVINEYINLGYMSKINTRHPNEFFLPHQAVIKEASMTTKVRVVFDASALSSTGISLNDALRAGPTIQDNIFFLLLRFRSHQHVLTGDIEKMYLQVKMQESDQPYLRILWKEEDGSLSTYQFNRLIFGLKPASYLATRCLQQLAEDEKEKYPLGSKILKRDLYVDDLLTGADTVEEVIRLRREITDLLRAGGFNLRQCASNTLKILNTIPDPHKNLQLQNDRDTTLKTLGVYWNSSEDAIIYTTKPSMENNVTKRSIFSEVAKIYDPLGLLNPVIVYAKLLIQQLWKSGVDWDESVSAENYTKWMNFIKQLPILNNLSFPRKILCDNPISLELHGFCDASKQAYGACIYLRSMDTNEHIHVRLLWAKSRVAPIKNEQTIPRLELCSAVLLAELYESVMKAIPVKVNRAIFWSDSMITLYWIRSDIHRLKAFVSSRVDNIQKKTDRHNWRHVRTHDNPADILTREILPAEFVSSQLWKVGPSWLNSTERNWPVQQWLIPGDIPSDLPETRKPKCLHLQPIDIKILERFSNYNTLQRVIARCLRFTPSNKHRKGPLTSEELQISDIKVIRLIQSVAFSREILALKKGEHVNSKNQLANLSPFLDNDCIIRVGGRLHNSEHSYSKKHPIILPRKNYITKLIIQQEHLRHLHAGVQTTLYALREKYWPLDGRNQVRSVIRSCITCARAKPVTPEYLMGQLPRDRITASRPFTNTGIDYCGPFYIKEKKYRNRRSIKAYVSFFICFATKAVHLEVVSDMTSETFIAALKRFISRRGKCRSLYSDNGTNFVGANNELKELEQLLNSTEHKDKVQQHLTNQGIAWKFNPPASPHFGGLWESAVRSFKHHLRRVIGRELFTFEQFNTLVIEIEAILNSRPLTPLSSDPNDLTPLTPAHFLIGDKLSNVPEHDFLDVAANRLSAWEHIQKVKQDFWKRWHKEYLNELNIRHKWLKGNHSIRPGSIVLLKEDNLPPLEWRMGRVLDAEPGPDKIVRVVRIKTINGDVMRNIKKLVLLPVDDTDNV